MQSCSHSGQQRALVSHRGKGEAAPSQRLSALRKERKEEIGKSREEVQRKIEKEWIGMEMKKDIFSQVDQIQPCTGARHKKINRKKLFLIPWLKLLIYLKTIE